MKYIALLRGINVGGKNKVAMSELRACFEQLGFSDVSTYINSGNVLFSTPQANEAKLVQDCEAAIETYVGFPVVVTVISANALIQAVDTAPKWWADGSDGMRNDALFVIPPTTGQEVLVEILQKATSVDKLEARGQVVYWSLPMSAYNKSVVPKIIGTPIYRRMTMRSATTTKKLYDLVR